jgi:RHS repeat-associated protein
MDASIRFPGALLVALFALVPPLAHAAVGRTPGAAWVTPAGAAAYSIPLSLPPGTAGLAPALSFEYRHDQAGGLLGAGWSIGGLSAISRCPRTVAQDGAAAPVQYSLQDRFCLDGRRLVVVNGLAYGASGSEYRTEVESYARIRAYGTAGAGPQYFLVETPDGRVHEYGATADSRIDAGGRVVSGVATPRTWALSRIRDRAGNVVDLQYAEEPTLQSYRIVAVRYNGNASRGIAASHTVQFVWESKPSSEVDLTYVAGTPIRQVVRLDRVDVLHEGALLRRYDLAYEPALSSAGRSRLASVQECGAGGTDCLAPTTLRWQDGVPGLGGETLLPFALAPRVPWESRPAWVTADFNGDGHSDLAWTSGASGSATLRYRLGTPSGLGPEVATSIVNAAPGVPFDYNGDGRADLLNVSASGQWMVIPGAANGLGTPVSTGIAAWGPLDFRGADVNGDGLGDIVWSGMPDSSGTDIEVRVFYARPGGTFTATPVTLYSQAQYAGYGEPLGGQFLGQPGQRIDLDGDGREDLLMNEVYSVARISATEAASDGFDGSPDLVTPADVNGDGCTDVVYLHYTLRWRIRFSGCGSIYWAAPEVAGPSGPGGSPVAFDWNGDGRQDLLLRDATSWYVMPSGGDRLLPIASTGLSHGGATSQARADVNGDGLDDVVSASTTQARVRLHSGPYPDLLASASDGFGVSASFAFAPLTRPGVHARLSTATFPQVDSQDGRPVVVALTATDGSGTGATSTVELAYEGLRRDAQGRGDLGFARRIVKEPVSGTTLRTEESWRQDFPFAGLPAARVLRQASGRAVQESAWQYAQIALGSGAALRRHPYVSAASERLFEAGGAYDGALHTSRAYAAAQVDPASGQPLDASWTTTEHGTGLNAGGSHTRRLLISSVLNDGANWCLGRPLSGQLTESHTLPGGTALTRSAAVTWDGLRCRPTQHQVEPGNPQWQVTTALGYDAFGNVASVAVTGAGMATRNLRIDWGARGQAPVSVTDPLSQTTTLQWSAATGLMSSRTDPNGLTTSWSYDAFGRLAAETRPDGTRSVLTVSTCTAAADCGDPGARYRLRVAEESPPGSTQWFGDWSLDRFDRWTVRRSLQPNGALSVVTRGFDARGRLARQDAPRWQGAAAPGQERFTYDSLDRPVLATVSSAAGVTLRSLAFEYRGLALTRRDAAGRASARFSTAWGDLAAVTDAAGGQTRYQQDAAGRLTQVVDAYGATVASATYNLRGMKVAQTDADLGAWTFTPNALGELVTQRDAKGQQVSYTYDLLSRPLSRTEPEGVTSWSWGSVASNTAGSRVGGRLLQVAGPGYSDRYGYDALSRPVRRTIVADATYEYAFGYDTAGRIAWMTYPASAAGYRLSLGYHYANGHLSRISDFNASATTFWRLEAADAAGRVLDETRGNGLRVITGAHPVTGDVEYRQAGMGGGASLQNLAMRWDAVGNLTERSDVNRGVTERFTYDALDRLDDVRRNGALVLDLAYDLTGNVTSRSDVGAYAYHPTRKHAVVSAGTHRYGYDANGNVTSRDGAVIAWTSYNLPSSMAGAGGASSAFWYTPDRQRWKQVATAGGVTETTVYAGGLLEKATRGSLTTWKHYIAGPGGTAAIHVRASDGSAPRTWAVTQDALGSTDRIVDAAGSPVLTTSFDAFGTRRGPGWSGSPTAADLEAVARTTRDGFTGHEQLDQLGLVHMGGRVYDPLIGRFMSPDPVVHAPEWSQDLNRYAYAWNNPLSIVDPTGYTETVPCLMDQGRCAQVTVYGLRDGGGGFEGWASWQFLSGQPSSARDRDPCGQDGSATACSLGTRFNDRPAPVVAVATLGQPALTRSSAIELLAGLAAQVGNLAMQSAPVFWIFDVDADYPWFQVPESSAGLKGSKIGTAATLMAGPAGAARNAARGITVLGKFPDYLNLAEKLSARRFNMPSAVWKTLKPADQWAANRRFLDRAITRDDEFVLSNPVRNVDEVRGAFRQEIEYLIGRGYRLSEDGSRMTRPGS